MKRFLSLLIFVGTLFGLPLSALSPKKGSKRAQFRNAKRNIKKRAAKSAVIIVSRARKDRQDAHIKNHETPQIQVPIQKAPFQETFLDDRPASVMLFEKKIRSEEKEVRDKIKRFLNVPDHQWTNLIGFISKVKSHFKNTILNRKDKRVSHHNSSVPKSVIELTKKIAVEYGIHPESFALELGSISSTAIAKVNFVYTMKKVGNGLPEITEITNPTPITIVFNKKELPTLMNHPLILERTIRHELMHVRELNGIDLALINLLEKEGYSLKKGMAKKIADYYIKIIERNTDILAAILNKKGNAVYKQSLESIHVTLEDDETHFSPALINKWIQLAYELYTKSTTKFDLVAASLSKEQLSRLA